MADQSNANDGIRLFAKAAITTVITINSGGLIAVLSQAEALHRLGAADAMGFALSVWATGVALGAVAWVCGVGAASAYANGMRRLELFAGFLGAALVLAAIVSFWLGASSLGWTMRALSSL